MLFTRGGQAVWALRQDWRWPHFTVTELACRCGGRFCDGEYWHDPVFLDGLEAMRAALGQPLQVNSGHRCGQWNAAVGGAPLSRHKQVAADLALPGHDRFAVLDAAKRAGFGGLGLARTFLHVDRRARPAVWFYRGSKQLWQR